MSLNDINIVRGPNGLGRPLPGEDFISGLVFYGATLPSGFSSSARIKQFFSILDAEAAGIVADYSDATASTSTYLVTNKGADTDTFNLKFTDPLGAVIDLGTYTVVGTPASVSATATAIAAVINAGTATHGFTASVGTATVTITAPKKYGIYPNSGTPYVKTETGTIAGTLTQNVVAGVASIFAPYHYHIAEYFRLQPQGNLYVGIFATAYTFAEIATMQTFAQGTIRQFGVFVNGHAGATSDMTTIQAVLAGMVTNHQPSQVLYAPNIQAVSDLTTLTDLTTFTNDRVSWVIGQDGGNLGNFLFLTTGKSVTCLGATLGSVSLSKVSENIGWVQKFNQAALELNTIAFANGTLYSAVTSGLLSAINSKGYIFLLKHIGTSGSYYNDSWTATAVTSDYCTIENNRTADKASRGIRTILLPQLSGPLQVNADGTLTADVIANYKALCNVVLQAMLAAGEISASKVTINPVQNVLATSTLNISVQIVPVGVARQITVTIGFTVSVA